MPHDEFQQFAPISAALIDLARYRHRHCAEDGQRGGFQVKPSFLAAIAARPIARQTFVTVL